MVKATVEAEIIGNIMRGWREKNGRKAEPILYGWVWLNKLKPNAFIT